MRVSQRKRKTSKYSRFAWTMDPEGNRVEPWKP